MFFQECFFDSQIPFPDLAQHPTDGFMNQIVRISQQFFGKVQSVGEMPLFDVMECRHHGYPSMPKIGGPGQNVQPSFFPRFYPAADNVLSRTVHQVPVVDITQTGKVEVVDASPLPGVSLLKLQDHNKEGQVTFFVNLRAQQVFDYLRAKITLQSRQAPEFRHPHPDKPITLTIFSWTRLEKLHLDAGSLFIRQQCQLGFDIGKCHSLS